MNTDSDASVTPGLRRALGTFDLVLMNIAAVVSVRWFSTAAQFGLTTLALWLIAFLVFFVPSALTVQELSSRLPHEGGLYLWTRAAFGDAHGFIVAWLYWVSNLVFFPALLLFVAGVFLHVGGGSWLGLADSPIYNGLSCLAALWAATWLNILGLSRAKWLQNVGGLTTLAVVALVIGAGVLAWRHYGSATPISAAGLTPDFASLPTLSMLALLISAYSGVELGPTMGDEIRNAAGTIRRAILISGVLIAVLYLASTAALLLALPAAHISAIGGIPEAMAEIGARAGIPAFGPLAAVLLTLSTIGGLGAWIAGTARLPFVLGLGHFLPERIGALHPKYGSPHVALLTQAALTSLALLAAIAGSTIREAFFLLLEMTSALTCVIYVYIFASLIVLRRRAAGRNEGISLIPGGSVVCWLVSGVGVAATLFGATVSLVPPQGSPHPGLFLFKGVGGCVLMLVIGGLIYRRGSRRMLRAQAAGR